MSFSCSTFASKCFLADCLHVIQFCQGCCSWSLHAMNLLLPCLASQTCLLTVGCLAMPCFALWWVVQAHQHAFIILFLPCMNLSYNLPCLHGCHHIFWSFLAHDGTPDLSSVLEVLGYVGIYGCKGYVGGATGAPRGSGARPRPSWAPPVSSNMESKFIGWVSFQK